MGKIQTSKCEDCRWCSWPVPYPHEGTFKCQRRPPVATGGMMCNHFTIWPEVKADDFCGEFELAVTQTPTVSERLRCPPDPSTPFIKG